LSNEIKIKTTVDNTGTKAGLKETEALVKKSSKGLSNEFKTLGKGVGDAFKSLSSGDIGSAFKSIAGSLGPVSLGITAIAGAATIASKEINRMITEGGKIADLAKGLDITNSEYQKLDLMAQLAGSSIEKIAKSMTILGKNAYEASNGSKTAQEAFDKLGISIKNSSGELKTKEELLRETFISLSKVKNSTEQTAMAQALLGKSAADLAPIYRGTTKEVEKYFTDMNIGVTYTDDMVQSSDLLGDNMLKLGKKFESVKNEQLAPFLSILSSLSAELLKILDQNKENPFGIDPARQEKYNQSVERLQTGFGKTNEELIKMGFSTMEIISIHQMYEAEISKSNQQSYLHSESISDVDQGWKTSLQSLQNYGTAFTVVKNQAAAWSVVKTTATNEELAAAKKIAEDAAKKLKEKTAAELAAIEKRQKEEEAYVDKIKDYAEKNQINLWSSDKKVVDGTVVEKTPQEILNDQLAIINAKFAQELENVKLLEKEDRKRGLNKFDDIAEEKKLREQLAIELAAKTDELAKQSADKQKKLDEELINAIKQKQENAKQALKAQSTLAEQYLTGVDYSRMNTEETGDNFREKLYPNVVAATFLRMNEKFISLEADRTAFIEMANEFKKLEIKDFSSDESKDFYRMIKNNQDPEKIKGFINQAISEQEKKVWEESSKILDNIWKYGTTEKPTTIFGNLFRISGEDETLIEERKNQVLDASMMITDAVMGYANAAGEMRRAKDQEEINAKTKAYEKEMSGLRLSNRAKVREEQKYQKEVEKLQEAQKEKDKKYKKANVWMNLASGIMSAWSTAMQFGPIAGTAIASATSILLSMTAGKQIDMINKYETGGIVPGASFSGDRVPAMVNSGEMILNAGQQRKLFDIANNGGTSGPASINIYGNVSQDHLQELEDMLYKLNSKSRLSFIGAR